MRCAREEETVFSNEVAILEWKMIHLRIFGQQIGLDVFCFVLKQRLLVREGEIDLGISRGGKENMTPTCCKKLSKK